MPLSRLLSFVLLLVLLASVLAAPTSAQGTDDDRLLDIPPAKTTETVPQSGCNDPSLTLIEMETCTRNSLASQEVNRNLNTEFVNYKEPANKSAMITIAIFIIASIALLLSELWQGRAFGYALVDVFSSRLFSWSWSGFWDVVQKLSAVAGLAQIGFVAVRYFFF